MHEHLKRVAVSLPCQKDGSVRFLRAFFIRAVLPVIQDVEVTLNEHPNRRPHHSQNPRLEDMNPFQFLSADQARLDNRIFPLHIADSIRQLRVKHTREIPTSQFSQLEALFGVLHRESVLQVISQ
jgi:hypothetical protein